MLGAHPVRHEPLVPEAGPSTGPERHSSRASKRRLLVVSGDLLM
jgi:hypothetical protein